MLQGKFEFSVAAGQSKGARPYQEDNTLVWLDDGHAENEAHETVLAVLADGMGGHVAGEVASRTVCDAYVAHFNVEAGRVEERLEHALSAANDALAQAIHQSPRLSGMGCTAVAAHVSSDGLSWASVGDSSLMLYRREQLFRINDDHSLGALLDKQAQAQVISHEDARNSPNRRSLRSAVTGARIPIADIARESVTLQPGDWVILASDGLETLSGDDIASIIRRHGDGDASELVDMLLDEVSRHNLPDQDNTSVIAVRVQPDVRASAQHETRPTQRRGSSESAQDTEPRLRIPHGVLIGQAREDMSLAPTVLIRSPERKSIFRWGTLALVVALVAVVLAIAPPLPLAELPLATLRTIMGGTHGETGNRNPEPKNGKVEAEPKRPDLPKTE